nr:hypothetical protein [Tanacetum cinerariifolium]
SVQLSEHQLRPESPGPCPAFAGESAGHRRSGSRRAGAGDLRLPRVGLVCPDPDHPQLDHRCHRRCVAGILRRLGGSGWPALSGDLVGPAGALPADHSRQLRAAQFLVAAGHHAAVL